MVLRGGGSGPHFQKWSVTITDHFKMKKKKFKNFGQPYGLQGQGGQDHIFKNGQ